MNVQTHNWKWLGALTIVGVLCLSPLAAQSTAEPNAASGASGQESAQDERDVNPDGSAQPVFNPFGEELGSRLHASGTVDYRYEYDDNVFASSLFKLSDHISNLSGRLSLGTRRKRSSFQLHYTPSYRIYSTYDDRNTFSQSLSNSWDYMFTGRTSMQWSASLIDRSNSSNSGLSFEDVGGVIVPVFHASALQNEGRTLSSHGGLDLTHRFSARTSMTVGLEGGTTNFFEQNHVPLLPGLANEQFSVGAHAGWEHQFRRGRFIGISAAHRYLGFMSPGSHVNYENVQLQYRQDFRHGYSLKLGAGPAFTQNSQPTQSLESTSYAIDASLAKVARGYQVAVGYQRGTQLGSVQGSAVSDTATASFTRNFRRWDAGGSISYSRSANVVGVERLLESVGLSVNAGYRLSRDLIITARYNHLNQFGTSAGIYASDFDRNTVSIGFSYRFGTEQGR